ncbi:helix-turn-helix domain-containing protein [Salinibaculum salinum]|uniref:helix-turn-helix domain-containing protein n=1 Tax=Salinibaculum salinum TaxID=3131996 RepID=UPI003A974216
MPPGIRATVEFPTPSLCPIVELSEAAETTIDSVSTSVCPSQCGESVTEFSIDSDVEFDTDLTLAFSYGSTDWYRLTHDEGVDCPCECLGKFGCPINRYVARDGVLKLGFHATDYNQLQDVIAKLRDRFPDVDIKRFVRTATEDNSRDSTFVDCSKLTSRQLEVLTTAYERGYFDRPRRANATEIATELDITPSTFREHLTAAESKILEDVL